MQLDLREEKKTFIFCLLFALISFSFVFSANTSVTVCERMYTSVFQLQSTLRVWTCCTKGAINICTDHIFVAFYFLLCTMQCQYVSVGRIK